MSDVNLTDREIGYLIRLSKRERKWYTCANEEIFYKNLNECKLIDLTLLNGRRNAYITDFGIEIAAAFEL